MGTFNRTVPWLVIALSFGCGDDDPATGGTAPTGGAPPAGGASPTGGTGGTGAGGDAEGGGGTAVVTIEHTFDEVILEPGAEILGQCMSWTLMNETELWINAVELDDASPIFEVGITFAPHDLFDGPDGTWKCSDRAYNQLEATVAGGVLYGHPAGAASHRQQFPSGAAIRIPPYSRIILAPRWLNTTDAPIAGAATLRLFSIGEPDVATKLVPFSLSYYGLNIPPMAESRFTGECAIEDAITSVGGSFDVDVHYVLPFTHGLGTRVVLDATGSTDDASLLDAAMVIGEPAAETFEPPVNLAGFAGMRFGCEYTNPRSDSVGWGFGDQEMCDILGFASGDFAFQAEVANAEPAGSEGNRQLFTGACQVMAFEWDHEKPGGTPPMK